ncbi:MAG: hypothetical protein B9J98_08365 [Candidatus Terraquivivens tikiterensis]|uniref:Glycosyltransferase 2-like domain-containing protein n=1 Tax=Candidatus Terraquivivens tikiterensis TaxID=1980982 RepID=A0A2R7Y0K0_9ARCH|nr:MAG: hypothetical protein B9J98_08365 [Candidatus Terraquivivens tikiterensis]
MKKVAVIVPTLDVSKAMKYVGKSLEGLPVKVVYKLDVYKNVSKTRNKGAEEEKDSDILFFIDDDVEILPEAFMEWVARLEDDERNVIWNEQPMILGIHRNKFLQTGGFDERIPFMSEDIELDYVLKKMERKGLVKILSIEPRTYVHHSSKAYAEKKRWLNEKHSVYTFLVHDKRRLLHAPKRYQDGLKVFIMRYFWLIWAIYKLLFFKRRS